MRRIIVAVTGASGVIYGVRALEKLALIPGVETHLIMTAGARATLAYETDLEVAAVSALAHVVHRPADLAAPISSGSFKVDGMLIAPCSIKTLSGIANCYDDNLVTRAADVTLKEHRRLVLMVRETPLHVGHIRLMELAAAAGAIIAPPMPAFYNRPATIDDLVDHSIARVLDLFGFDVGADRWDGGGDSLRAKSARRVATSERNGVGPA